MTAPDDYSPVPAQQHSQMVPPPPAPVQPYSQPDPTVAGPRGGKQFAFTGGAATYFGTGILAFLITVLTLGIMYPFALVLLQRWRCKHSYINGQQLQFNGLAIGLFGLWIKWLFLIVITLGIYSFWVAPRVQRWKWEHTGFVGHVVATQARI